MQCARLVELVSLVYELSGHMTHAVAKVALGIGEYVPSGQSKQRTLPANGEYLPGGHGTQLVPVPKSCALPGAQGVHCAAPW